VSRDTAPSSAVVDLENPSRVLARVQDIALSDLVTILFKQRKIIGMATLAMACLSLVVAFSLPVKYTAIAIIMPPQQDQSTANAILGQIIGGSSATGGVAAALGLKNPNDLYVGILKSRTIADAMIQRFKFMALYDEDTLIDTRKELESNTTITAGKDGLIKIEFEDEDPNRAAAVANAYIEELEKLTATLAISEASRRRLYYETQVGQARAALTRADAALQSVQERTGLIKPDDQARAIFEVVANLRARIAAKEVELAAMKTFATDQNAEYRRGVEELVGMQKQLSGLERDNRMRGGNILIPTRKVPEAGREYLKSYRDVKYYESVYELLAKQLELAKIDEGKNATIIQVVDKAVEPDKKSKPKRSLIVVLSTLLAFILSALFVFAKETSPRKKLL
jgi:tyrosine-protein kinase Etk/Wzc